MNQKKLIPMKHKNERILTTAQLAQSYETTPQKIRQNFNNNKGKYIKDKHYFCLEGSDLKEFKRNVEISDVAGNVNKIYLWTERGALLHAKSLGTDTAWKVYEILVETYFRAREINASLQPPYNQVKAFSVGEVVNLIKTLRSTLIQQNVPDNMVAAQVELTCRQFGVKTIDGFVKKSGYVQQLTMDNHMANICIPT